MDAIYITQLVWITERGSRGSKKEQTRIIQTVIDPYSKVAAAKLYTEKTPITAADLLNDRLLPEGEALSESA